MGFFYFCTMNLILFDDLQTDHLLPVTYTRPAADIRLGITTIREKWESAFGVISSTLTHRKALHSKFPIKIGEDNIYINGRFTPNPTFIQKIKTLELEQGLGYNGSLLAYRTQKEINLDQLSSLENVIEKGEDEELIFIKSPSDIFIKNEIALKVDFRLITTKRVSEEISSTNTLIGNQIFFEEGAKAEACIFNSNTGPIYIGKDAEVMEGSVIRGPFALGEHATVKMSSKIYGATTVGSHCKVGGELNNVVIQGFSNKAHDGFLGNAFIGEWCNLGADTNNSNLKNNYAIVKLWDYPTARFADTGLQFCGLIMGDHAKTGINTMLNTGTVIGMGANVFGAGFPRNFIPSFAWGGERGFETFQMNKFLEVASKVMARRGLQLMDADLKIFEAIFEEERKFRSWEKN